VPVTKKEIEAEAKAMRDTAAMSQERKEAVLRNIYSSSVDKIDNDIDQLSGDNKRWIVQWLKNE